MVPDGWKNLAVKDIADIVSGAGFPRKHQGNQVGEIPFFKVSDMNTPGNERGLRVAANTVDKALLDSLKGKLHPPGTVVFPKVGAALLTNKRRRLVVPSCFDNNVMGLVATGCGADYLYLLMQAVDFADHVQSGAVPSINGSTVGGIRVLVPPFPEQRKIAAILSSVDDAIEKTQAVIDQAQVVKRGLMQELLTRGLSGQETRSRYSLKTEPLAELVVMIRNGTTATQNQNGLGLPVSRIETISDGFVDYSRVRHIEPGGVDIEAYRLHPGDILMSHINSVKHIGKVARYDGKHPLIHGMNLLRIVFDQRRVDPLFGFYVLSSNRTKRYFEKRAKRAINQASLNRRDIGDLKVVVPPIMEQRKIASVLSIVDDVIEQDRAMFAQAQATKQALKSVLLTGELRVIPDTEAA